MVRDYRSVYVAGCADTVDCVNLGFDRGGVEMTDRMNAAYMLLWIAIIMGVELALVEMVRRWLRKRQQSFVRQSRFLNEYTKAQQNDLEEFYHD